MTVAGSGAGIRRASSTAASRSSATLDSRACNSASPTPAQTEPGLVHEERVTGLPPLDLLGGPVALRVALVVTVPAERRRLEDRGTSPRPHGGDHVLHGRRRRHHVVAVDGGVGDAVPGGPALEGRPVLGRRGREFRIPVVLAEEDHRQLPHGGEVHRLVERALRRRPVAEEGHGDAAISSQLGCGGGAHGDRRPGGDDPVGPEDADPRVGDVHRTAPAAVRTPVLAHQLAEHPERVEALGQAVPVAPMGRGDHVIGSEGPARTHGGGLLSGGEVDEAGDLAVAVERRHPLLEATDHQHAAVHLDELGGRAPRSGGKAVGHGL